MEEFEEVIVVQRVGFEFDTPTSILEIQIPGQTQDLKRLELKELKIGINAASVGTNTSWITLDIKGPGGGLIPSAGQKLATVPALDAAGLTLYRQYHHDNLVLLKLNCKQATMSSKSFRLQILQAAGLPLAIDYIYLRMGLFEAKNFAPYLQPLDVNRFQAL